MAYKIKVTGRWSAQGRDANGKRIQLGTFATKREAQAAEAEHKRQRPQSDITVTEWRKHWLTRREWKESTRLHNEERTKAFVDEYGKKRLGAINRTLAREFLHDHPSCLGALSAMFGAAMYEDDEQGNALLESNPFSRLVKRMASRRDLKADWLTAQDVAAIEETAFRTIGGWAGAMVRFVAETGVRPGELFVLEHGDLNPTAGVATIRRAANSRTRTVGLPKNGRAREIVLSAAAADAAASSPYVNGAESRIFSTPSGRQFWNNSLVYYWHQIRAAAGRPDMDFYELRHYCATRLLEHGLDDRDVAIQLGHTDGGELVRRVYGHPSERRALDRVREALDRQEDA
jgi:integrase